MRDIAVIGLGIFGWEVAVQLEKKQGNKVLAIDVDRDVVERIKEHVTEAVRADITDENALRELDLARFNPVILGLGSNFEKLILGVTHLKRLGAQRIIARAATEIQEEILFKVGADEVILPEKQSAVHLVERINFPSILDYIEIDDEVDLAEVLVGEELAGKTLRELNLRSKYNVLVLLHKREGCKPKVITSPDEVFQANDQLVVVGKEEDIGKIFK
ncbi:MAG: TrkA family potassium uptake protein [Desulfobulbaceae bacterium]|nr:TrkA family potassium uptake protein [Desulfobulbaceae bacterium]